MARSGDGTLNQPVARIMGLTFDRLAEHMLWFGDAPVPTEKCRHCQGTGLAPGDGATECGFCFSRDSLTNRLG